MNLRTAPAVPWIVWLSGFAAAQTALGPAWTAEGNQVGAGFGSSVSSAGDVNGDGYGDVILGASAFDNDQTNEGRAFVFHGSKAGLAKLPAWTVESNQAHASINDAAAAGDVNGDGYADVIVASSSFSNGEYLEGKAFLFLGSAAGLATSPAWSAEGNEQAAYFGIAVAAAGDVDGDGFGDVIVGGFFGDLNHTPQGEGAAFLYLGSAAGLSANPDWTAWGNQRFCGFGSGTSAADFNADGYDDLVVSAYAMSNGQRLEGRVFVYLGSATGPSTSADWTTEGDQEEAYLGSSVGSADVNGDGYDDLIVGVAGYRSGQFDLSPDGLVAVYLGSAAGLSSSPAWTMTGDQRATDFGLVAGAGDMDGDGFDDVLIGAPGYTHGQRDEGRVFTFFGSALGLRPRTSWIVEGDQNRALFGAALAGAGDVNGDGYHDVIVAAPQFDSGQANEGLVFVYLGSSRRRLP